MEKGYKIKVVETKRKQAAGIREDTPEDLVKVEKVVKEMRYVLKIGQRAEITCPIWTNEKEISNGTSNKINYKIYKGDTLKRTIYFYHNKKKIYSFQLKKYENKSGILELNKTTGINILNISGLELEKIIKFNHTISNVSKKIQNKTIKSKESSINFSNITNNLKNQINQTIFLNKNFKEVSLNTNLKKENLKETEKKIYSSENNNSKNYSIYFILIGIVILLSVLIFLW